MNMMGSFKTSVEINIFGTLQLVNLAKKMVNLKTFVHLSSLAGFWDQDKVEEKLYASHLEYEDCLNLLKINHVLPMDEYDKKRIVGDKILIYSLTKSTSENIFIREKISFPVTIFRFSIAAPCWKEPVPGWTAGFYGPNGLIALSILRITSIVYCKDTSIKDFIPVDLIVNALLAATQHSYDKFQKTKECNEEIIPAVYNYSAKNYKNASTIENCIRYAKQEFSCIPIVYSNKIVFLFWSIFTGYIPALLIDLLSTLFRKKLGISAFQTYDELVNANLSMIVVNWHQPVKSDNLENCWINLNDADRELFSFDLNEVNWKRIVASVSNYAQEYFRTLIEKDKRMRLAVFWIPNIRFAFKLLYFGSVVWSIHFIYMWLLYRIKQS